MSEDFEEVPVQSRGFGILDVGYRSEVSCRKMTIVTFFFFTAMGCFGTALPVDFF